MRILPPGYEVYLTIVGGGRARSCGLAGMASLETGGDTRLDTEIAHIPFSIVLTVGPHRVDEVGRISRFGECFYDERRDVNLLVAGGDIYTLYPRDFRAEAAVLRARRASEEMMKLPPEEYSDTSDSTAAAMRRSTRIFGEKMR